RPLQSRRRQGRGSGRIDGSWPFRLPYESSRTLAEARQNWVRKRWVRKRQSSQAGAALELPLAKGPNQSLAPQILLALLAPILAPPALIQTRVGKDENDRRRAGRAES